LTEFSSVVSSIEESRTLAISSRIKELKAAGKDVLSFSAGEPDFATPDYIKKAAIEAIHNDFTTYTANEGHPDLLKVIVKKLREENDLHFETKNIVVSHGVKHSLYNLIMSICSPGDEVVYQSPYWVSYPEMVKLARAESVVINAGVEQEYKITPGQLENALTDKTKIFIFNSPSNPTGAVYSEEEIKALAGVLKGRDLFIISDEIYEKIVFDGEKHFCIGSIDYLRDNTITVNGVSKSFAMTGWRIGYAAGDERVIRLARNLQSHSTSNATSISQMAAKAALTIKTDDVDMMIKKFIERRDYLYKEISGIKGIKATLPKGAFYLFFDVGSYYGLHKNGIEIKDSNSFCSYLLQEEHVGLVPGIAFGSDTCVRMSYACAEKDLEEGVKRIKRALSALH
jgi:aspartate aminotransferase